MECSDQFACGAAPRFAGNRFAIAFAIKHPTVTSAIIGPRTMEQLDSQLGSDEVKLSDEVLDRIDKIVPPGKNFSAADGGWENPALAPRARRRAWPRTPTA